MVNVNLIEYGVRLALRKRGNGSKLVHGVKTRVLKWLFTIAPKRREGDCVGTLPDEFRGCMLFSPFFDISMLSFSICWRSRFDART